MLSLATPTATRPATRSSPTSSDYAETFELPVELGSAVRSLTKSGDTFVLELDGRTIEADQVVVATGPFQMPRVPEFAGRARARRLPDPQRRLPRRRATSREGTVAGRRRRQHRLPDRRELAATHDVHLAVGARQTPLPQRLLGRDLFWWLDDDGLFKTTVDSRLGQKLSTATR